MSLRRWRRSALPAIAAVTLGAAALVAQTAAPASARRTAAREDEWPKPIRFGEMTVALDAPQAESLEGTKLMARGMARIQRQASEPSLGTIWYEAEVEIDRGRRTLTLTSVNVPRVQFAGVAPAAQQRMATRLSRAVTRLQVSLPLDDVLAGVKLAARREETPPKLNSEPPRILFESEPAMPSNGKTGCDSGNYARKHNPWVNFTNVSPASNRTLGALPKTYALLPTVAFVVPNLCNDMHDCSVATGDNWLRNNMDPYIQWAKTANSLFIPTFDESDSPTNQITTIFVGPMVLPGDYGIRIDHYSVLRALEELYGVPLTGSAVSASPVAGAFAAPTPIPTPALTPIPPETPTPDPRGPAAPPQTPRGPIVVPFRTAEPG